MRGGEAATVTASKVPQISSERSSEPNGAVTPNASRLTPHATKVGLFVTCLVDLMRPSIGFAALKLLEQAGCEVVVPQTQTCCGQPGYNSGDRASALALARKVLSEFEDCDYVVAPSGSCAGMIRTHYPELFAGQPELARVNALCAGTYELTEFLLTVMKFAVNSKSSIKNSFKTSFQTYAYHDACSGLRELGVKAQPRALLAQVEGITLKEMDECETCCGFGGAFAVKLATFPRISLIENATTSPPVARMRSCSAIWVAC